MQVYMGRGLSTQNEGKVEKVHSVIFSETQILKLPKA